MKNYIEVLKKYAVFSGRATRKEYWLFVLVNLIIGFAIGFIFGILSIPKASLPVSLAYGLAILIPSIAVTVRRLHDTGRSAWWLCLALIPYLGALVLFIFYVLDSQPGDNQYGPNPKGVAGPGAGMSAAAV